MIFLFYLISCFARADNGKMLAANESYALKMNIIVILWYKELNISRSSSENVLMMHSQNRKKRTDT